MRAREPFLHNNNYAMDTPSLSHAHAHVEIRNYYGEENWSP